MNSSSLSLPRRGLVLLAMVPARGYDNHHHRAPQGRQQ